MVSEYYVVIAFVLAGVGCIVYAFTRRRRKARALFGWIALPSFEIAGLYLWFILWNIPVAARVVPARLSFILLGLVIAVTMFTVTGLSHESK